MKEFGKGFSFIGNQYKISTNNSNYYIDLLFYHLDLRCYIVVESKSTNFKPEYIGKLSFYITAVNKTLRKEEKMKRFAKNKVFCVFCEYTCKTFHNVILLFWVKKYDKKRKIFK